MKVLIAVGGGGHFSPALSVIQQMPHDWEVLLVGRKQTFEGDSALSLEYQTAVRLGLPFEPITTGRFQRKFTGRTLRSLAKMPVGFAQAKRIITEFHPTVVFSFGGYVSVPVVLAAWVMRVPVVIHEQTLNAGLANKIASHFARKICISWEESARFFPKNKIVLTGNPIRKEFIQDVSKVSEVSWESKVGDALLYITGGSGGAHGINSLIEGCLEKLLEKFTLVHQTGDAKEFGDFERLRVLSLSLPETLQKKYRLEKFIKPEEVLSIMKRADLVVARSGINTVTELLYLGKPSLFIPLPYGQRNEQLTNAEFVKKIGLAEIVDQLTTAPDELFEKVSSMISHIENYKSHREEARLLIHPDAAAKIIQVVQTAYETKNRDAA